MSSLFFVFFRLFLPPCILCLFPLIIPNMYDFTHPVSSVSLPIGSVSLGLFRDSFSDCADFRVRTVSAPGERPCHALWLEGCISGGDAMRNVLQPLSSLSLSPPLRAIRRILSGSALGPAVTLCRTAEEALAALPGGSVVLLFDSVGVALALEEKTAARRAVTEPTVEKTVLGAKDAFTETLRTNTSLLRRRMRTPKLKLREFTLGARTKTAVDLLYIEGSAPTALTDALSGLLSSSGDTDILTTGDLERLLSASPRGAFPRACHTERPDRFLQGLLSGQAGLLVDNIPVGLLLPGTLPELMRVGEDSARHAVVARSLAVLRTIALFVSLLLPSLYVAVAMYHPEMIPYELLLSVIESKQAVPFSTAAEVLGMLLAFEFLQEAGIRLPESIGQTVSVIGALIVGQSAVDARVLSPIVIIVVAVAGIAGYTVPSQELSSALRLWRFLLVLAAMALGAFGIMAALCVLFWRLCDAESFSRAYLYPLCDGDRPYFRRLFPRREEKRP